MDVKALSQSKLAEIRNKLETACQGYSPNPKYKYLAEISALDLQRELLALKKQNQIDNKLSEAISQFHERQRIDQNRYMALTDVLTKEALKKAEEIEAKITPNNRQDFPLYGFILSLKDSINQKGYPSNCGLVANMQVWEKETPFIDYIESKGAVFISRANVPQMLFAIESWNNIFGNTSNAYDHNRVAGGTTGGDAVLIALGHVNGAIGSDFAGSLRVPALFNGICAMNTTAKRIDRSAHATMFEQTKYFSILPEGQYKLVGTIGPMAKNVDDLEVLTKVLFDYNQVNSRIAPVSWRTNLLPVKRVGVVVEWDHLFELTETNRRAMAMTREVLHKACIETVDFDMRSYVIDLVQAVCSIFYKDNYINAALTGSVDLHEPLLPMLKNFQQVLTFPKLVIAFLLKVLRDQKKTIFLKAFYDSLNYNEMHFTKIIDGIRDRMVKQMKDLGIEMLLCHGMMPAVLKETTNDTNLWAMYTLIWNGLRFAGGALPVTRVREDEQYYNSKFNGIFESSMRRCMNGSAGLPVGIQVISFSWREEMILKLMKILETGLQFK